MSKAEVDAKISRVSESVSQGGEPRVSIEGLKGGAVSGMWPGRGGLRGTGFNFGQWAGWDEVVRRACGTEARPLGRCE